MSPRRLTGGWLAQERPTGTFRRQLRLGDDVDSDNITAAYENGVVTLNLPIAQRAKPRRIQITADESGKVLQPSAADKET